MVFRIMGEPPRRHRWWPVARGASLRWAHGRNRMILSTLKPGIRGNRRLHGLHRQLDRFCGLRKSGEPLFFLCRYSCGVWLRVCAGRGALPRDRRRTSQNRVFGFCSRTSVMTGGSVFNFVGRATPIAQERAPPGCTCGHAGAYACPAVG
jgi:hypothetical protein